MGSPLDDLVNEVNNFKDRDKIGDSGAIGTVVSIVLVLIVTAIYGFVAWSKGREMAKLLLEKARAEEDEHRAQVDAKLASNEDTRQAALKSVEDARTRVITLEQARRQIEEDHRAARNQIDSITSWSDVDRYMDSH